MRQLRVWLGLLLLAPLMSAAAGSHESMTLPNQWRVQPAANPAAPPDPKAWATVDLSGWRKNILKDLPETFRNLGRKDLGWASLKPEEVNRMWYEREFQAPPAWRGRRILLDLTEGGGDAVVFLNGKRAGELLRGDYELDITPFVDWQGPNQLRLYFARDYAGISRGFEQDKFQHQIETHSWSKYTLKDRALGLRHPVKLAARPLQAVTDIFAVPDWRHKRLELELEVTADKPLKDAVLSAVIRDANGKEVLAISGPAGDIPAGVSTRRIGAAWSDFVPWELEAPYLYTAQVELKSGAVTLDSPAPVRFGFRELWCEGRKFMLNGHPMRWRQVHPCGAEAAGLPGLAFLRLMGYNFMFQPSIGAIARFNEWDEAWLDLLDEQGFGTNLPIAPQSTLLREALVEDPALAADYERIVTRYLRKYRNHPCIMAWYVGYNAFCPIEHINPQGMGRPPGYEAAPMRFIKAAYDIVKRHDPTRYVYSHADGGTGDIASSNIYLNFAPLQEREDWPMLWAENGLMPYLAAEMGTPIPACFWKDKSAFLMTEYCAIYQGDAAYRKESEAGLRKTIEYGLKNQDHFGCTMEIDLDKDFPNIRDFYRLFVKNTNRAWRTWGIPGGWLYFDFEMPFVDKKKEGGGLNTSNCFSINSRIGEVVTRKPAWATESFDIHREANLPLLAYVAGWPKHTDKTHAFYAGETIHKQLAVVYDGSAPREFAALWTLEDGQGRSLVEGKLDIQAKPGDIALLPFEFQAPAVTERTALTLRLSFQEKGQEIQKDAFPLQVFPREQPLAANNAVALYDPLNKSLAGLRKLGVEPRPWKPGDSLRNVGVLVIGREGLSLSTPPPYTKEDIATGLKVLVLEQRPQVWEAMGLRSIETMPRYVFMRDQSHPVCAGLAPEDLLNWRGSPDLLPEGKQARPYDVTRAPKWTNTHAVASTALQVPEVVGFTPLLSCEFDSNYSPLLQWRYGKGEVCFSSLDFSGRLGEDPAATRLARNLLAWLGREAPAPRRLNCYYQGGAAGRQLLEKLCVKVDPGVNFDKPETSLLVVGAGEAGTRPAAERLAGFAAAGGLVVYLGNTAAELKALGLNTQRKDLVRLAPPASPLFQGIGPSLLRWRDSLPMDAIEADNALGEGAFLVRERGKGAEVFVQVTPALLEGRYKDDKPRQVAVGLSVVRLYQLMAQLFTNLGAPVAEREAARLMVMDLGAEQEVLATWQVLGPFPVSRDDSEYILNTKFQGEESAILGDTRPDVTYLRPDKVGLDWRGTVTADGKGFVDLGRRLLPGGLAVAYVSKRVRSETARTARLKLGVDWRLMVWVNGKLVFRTLTGAPSPQFMVDIPLKAGDNVIGMKIGSGSSGFGFYATLSKPMVAAQTLDPALRGVKFYDVEKVTFDPYMFSYW